MTSKLIVNNIESLETGRVIEVDSLSDRQDLANDASGYGASLVSMEGGPTVEVAVLDRVIRVASVAAIEALSGVADYQVSLTGLNAGTFTFSASDLSVEVSADPGQSRYIAPSGEDGSAGAWVINQLRATAVPSSNQNIAQISKLTAQQRQITTYDYTKHKAFGFSALLPSGRYVYVYTEGITHVGQETGIQAIHSDDDGLTWTDPVLVNDTGRPRNVGGGVDSNGTIFAFFSDFDEVVERGRIATSTDGITWTFGTMPGSAGAIGYYAHCFWERADGRIYVAGTTTGMLNVQIQYSDNSGTSWTSFNVAKPTDDFTEITFVQRGETIVGIGRENVLNGGPYAMRSLDGGDTWLISQQNAVTVGKNPVTTYYESRTDMVHLFFTSREETAYPDGGIGQFWPWYWAKVDMDELLAGIGANVSASWHRATALPIAGAPHNTEDADQGYGTISIVGEVAKMIWYFGRYNTTAAGTELMISNMTAMVGIE